MSVLLAYDPGKITGWAMLQDGVLTAGQLPAFDFVAWADDNIAEGWDVVGETFSITKRTLTAAADAHWALGVLGSVEYWCQRRSAHHSQQSPGEAKGFGTDDKLRTLGWYQATKGGHRNDACRHLLVRAVRTKQIDTRLLLASE